MVLSFELGRSNCQGVLTLCPEEKLNSILFIIYISTGVLKPQVICPSLNKRLLQAVIKSLGSRGPSLARAATPEKADILDWAQLAWRCPSNSSSSAPRLLQSLDWESIAATLTGDPRCRPFKRLRPHQRRSCSKMAHLRL